MNHIKNNTKLSDFGVPPENVLDLRTNRARAPKPRTRREVLETFWLKKSARTTAPRSSVRASRKTAYGVALRFRTAAARLHVGSFPIIVAGILLTFAFVTVANQFLNIRQRVLAGARAGYQSLKIAAAKAASYDLTEAASAFESAEESFQQAETKFQELNPVLIKIASNLPLLGSKIRSSTHLLAAARLMSSAGSRFSVLAIPLSTRGEGFSAAASLIANIEQDREQLQAIVSDIRGAAKELKLVDPEDLPSEYREQVERLQSLLPGLEANLSSIVESTTVAGQLLGVDTPAEFLFVFQNSNELRASGGFMGSFALIRLDRGTFRILDAPGRGSLGVDDFLPATITPPVPLQVITPSWYFRDANWYPDFPTSAQQIVRFYEMARGFKPAGVIALTHKFLERLLAVTGPIALPEYDVTVDAENVTEVAQEQIELKYNLRLNNPKQFIVDLIPALTERLAGLDLGRYPALLAAMIESIRSGDVQVWSADPLVQERLITLGWSGAMSQASGDFFQLVDSNIGGGKTDGVIEVKIRDYLAISTQGKVTETVEVTRTHRGVLGDLFTGSRNRTYHRLYVPRGSKLLSAEGFSVIPSSVFQALPQGSQQDALFQSIQGRVTIDEQSGTRINDEFGKTVFGNWTELDPGETRTFRFTYELPFILSDDLERYDLTIGKQPGAGNRVIAVDIALPKSWKMAWSSVDISKVGSETFSTTIPDLDHQEHLSFVFKR